MLRMLQLGQFEMSSKNPKQEGFDGIDSAAPVQSTTRHSSRDSGPHAASPQSGASRSHALTGVGAIEMGSSASAQADAARARTRTVTMTRHIVSSRFFPAPTGGLGG